MPEESRQTELPELSIEEQIEAMAANGNTFTEMAVILGLSRNQFAAQAEMEGTKYNLAIKRGILKSEYLQANALRSLAETGNITGKQEFNKHIKAKNLQKLRERIYYGQ